MSASDWTPAGGIQTVSSCVCYVNSSRSNWTWSANVSCLGYSLFGYIICHFHQNFTFVASNLWSQLLWSHLAVKDWILYVVQGSCSQLSHSYLVLLNSRYFKKQMEWNNNDLPLLVCFSGRNSGNNYLQLGLLMACTHHTSMNSAMYRKKCCFNLLGRCCLYALLVFAG